MDTEKLIHRLAKEWLRSTKLCGTLEKKLGFDCTEYYMNLTTPLIELMGIPDTTDKILDIFEKYEEEVISMSFFLFIEEGLEMLTNEMVTELSEYLKTN